MSKRLLILMLCCVTALTAFQELAASSSRKDIYMRRQEKTSDCKQHLQNINGFLTTYAKNNQGKYPADNNFAGLKNLLKLGLSHTVFYCENYRGKKTKKLEDLNEETNPYLYFGGFDMTGSGILPLIRKMSVFASAFGIRKA